jgi:uncharacterized membrane-anchored protein
MLMLILTALVAQFPAGASDANRPKPACQEIPWRSFKPRAGDMRIENARATIKRQSGWRYIAASDQPTGEAYAFLAPTCVEDGVTGYLVPPEDARAGTTWAVEIRYHDVGYVSTEDAISADYEWMMQDMQSVYRRWNVEREHRGETPIDITGWAVRPDFLPEDKSMMWSVAKIFSTSALNPLDLKLVKVGRRGFIEFTVHTSANRVGEDLQLAHKISKATVFDPNFRHEEFDPAKDQIADFTMGEIVSSKLRVDYPQKIGSVGHWMQGLQQVTKKIVYFLFETMFLIIGAAVLICLQIFRGHIIELFKAYRQRRANMEVNPPPRRI